MNVPCQFYSEMAASPGGAGGSSQPPGHQVPPNPQLTPCMWCKGPLPHPGAPFCNMCSQPQKKCINCPMPIPPSYPLCPYCRALQHETKLCLNPQCKMPLYSGAAFCATCQAPQDPAMFQHFLTAGQCISCSTKLLISGQPMCHACGAPQHTLTSMEHSSQSMVHSQQYQPPPQMVRPPLVYPQSSSQHPPNLSQPQHPQPPFPPQYVPQSTEQQYLLQEQQSNKRSPDSNEHLANKKSRTEQAGLSNTNSQMLVGEAAVHQQVPQAQFTSPATAASAHGTPIHPVPPQGASHYPVCQSTSQPCYLPAAQTTDLHPTTQGTDPSCTYPGQYPGTPQPSHLPSSTSHGAGSPLADSQTLRAYQGSTFSDANEPGHYPAIQDTRTIYKSDQLVSPALVEDPQAYLGPTLPIHDASVPMQKHSNDDPQKTRNLPQQPWVISKTKVDQEKERKRIKNFPPNPQSGDSDNEFLSLKKRHESGSQPKSAEKPHSEQEEQRYCSPVKGSPVHVLPLNPVPSPGVSKDNDPLPPAGAVPLKTDDPIPSPGSKDKDPIPLKTDDPVPSPGVSKDNDPLPPAGAVPLKTDDPVPSPEVSKEDDPLSPAGALPLKTDDPVPSPEVSKEDDPLSPAGALPLKTDDPVPSPGVSKEDDPLSPAGALPLETDDPVPSPGVSKEDDPLSPAGALPLKTDDPVTLPKLFKDNEQLLTAHAKRLSSSSYGSISSPNFSNSEDEEYGTPHGSRPNSDDEDSSSSSSSSSPCPSPVFDNTNKFVMVMQTEQTDVQDATDKPERERENLNNLDITAESKQAMLHKDTVSIDLVKKEESGESQEEPLAITSFDDPLTKHTGNSEKSSAIRGEQKDSSKKDATTSADKKKKIKKVL